MLPDTLAHLRWIVLLPVQEDLLWEGLVASMLVFGFGASDG